MTVLNLNLSHATLIPIHGHYNTLTNSIDACPSLKRECEIKSSDILFFFYPNHHTAASLPTLFLETCLPWPTRFQLEPHLSSIPEWNLVSSDLMHFLTKTENMVHVTVPALKLGFQTLWFEFGTRKIPTIIQCQETICYWAK